jgi:hypothetical protein
MNTEPSTRNYVRLFISLFDDYPHFRPSIVIATPGLPSFHTMGVSQLMHPLYTGRPTVIFRPTYPRPPTVTSPQTVLDTLKAVRAGGAFVVPSLLETWVHDQAAVDYLKTLNILVRQSHPKSAAVPAKGLTNYLNCRLTAEVRSLPLSGMRLLHRDAASHQRTAAPSSASSLGSTLRSIERHPRSGRGLSSIRT